MSRAGRKPKPTALKKAQGTLRKSRVRDDEVDPETIEMFPKAPEFLSENAKKEWNVVLPQLVSLGILATVDMAMITAYCIEWGEYISLHEDLQTEGVINKKNGQPNPKTWMKSSALKNAIKLASEFGFTPSSRTGIAGPQKKKEDPFETILKNATA